MYCTRCHGIFDLDVSRRTIDLDSLEKENTDILCERCSCLLELPPGEHIRLEFSVFQLIDLSWQGSVSQDWLYVFDGNSTKNALLGKFTGTKLPFTVQSSSHLMMIQFKESSGFRSIFKSSYYNSTTKGKLIFIRV